MTTYSDLIAVCSIELKLCFAWICNNYNIVCIFRVTIRWNGVVNVYYNEGTLFGNQENCQSSIYYQIKGEKLARELHNQAWNENGLLQGKSPIKDRYRCTVSNILKLRKAVDGKFKSCISKWEIYYN